MQAVVIDTFGPPSGLSMIDVEIPTPEPGQVVVHTIAIGVGGVDAMIRRGTLGTDFPLGQVLGSEAAGIVTAVGEQVSDDWIGKRVWAFTGLGGGYAEYVVAAEHNIVELPDSLAYVDAVALGGAAPVAYFALRHGHISAGESLLIRGAAGSIGLAVIEIAHDMDVSTVAVTTSSVDRASQLSNHGATYILDRMGFDITGNSPSFDVIIDMVGGEAVTQFVDRLNANGRYVLVGAIAGMPAENFGAQLLSSFQRSRSFATFSLNSVAHEAVQGVRSQLFDAAANEGRPHPVVHARMPLASASQAHQFLDRGDVFGRIVLEPEH